MAKDAITTAAIWPRIRSLRIWLSSALTLKVRLVINHRRNKMRRVADAQMAFVHVGCSP
jgi:hypothetical protein